MAKMQVTSGCYNSSPTKLEERHLFFQILLAKPVQQTYVAAEMASFQAKPIRVQTGFDLC